MNKEEYDKYKKVVAELDGYDICDEFNLGTYELKDKKKLLEIVLMYYFKNQDELDKKDKEIDRLNNIIDELEKDLDYEINDYTGNIDMKEETLSGEFCRGIAWEADYLKNRIKELKEGK